MVVSLEAAPVNWGKQQVEGADIVLSVTENEREDNSGRIYGDVTSLTVTLRSGDPRVGNPGISKGVASVGEAAAAPESEIFVIESPDTSGESSGTYRVYIGLRRYIALWTSPCPIAPCSTLGLPAGLCVSP